MATFAGVYKFDYLPDFSGGSFSFNRLFATIGPSVFYLQNGTYPWIMSGTLPGSINKTGSVSCEPTFGLVYVGRENQGSGNAEVYRSADSGISYTLDYTIINMQQVSASVIDSSNNNLFVGTHAFAGGQAEIHKRTPGGLWSLVHTFPVGYWKVTDLLHDSVTNDLYASVSFDGSTPGEVLVSQDGGTTWTTVFVATDGGSENYPYVSALEYFNGSVYVLVSDPGDFIYTYSTNNVVTWTENNSFPVLNPGDVGVDLKSSGVSLLASMGNLSTFLGINAKTYCTEDGTTWSLDMDFNIPPVNNGTGFTTESSVTALGYDTILGKYYCGIGNIDFPDTNTYIYSCPTADIGAPAEPSGGGGGGGG